MNTVKNVNQKDFCMLIPYSDPGRVTGYKKQLWSTEQSVTGGASNSEFLGLWSACGVFGSICYGTKDVLRKNNQRIFCTNGGMFFAPVAVIFIIFAELLETFVCIWYTSNHIFKSVGDLDELSENSFH
jgi:hypothetical protein